jgi:hypothetical protein
MSPRRLQPAATRANARQTEENERPLWSKTDIAVFQAYDRFRCIAAREPLTPIG